MKPLLFISACVPLVIAAFAPFAVAKPGQPQTGVVIFDDKALGSDFEKKMGQLLKDSNHTPYEALVEQLSRTSCRLELPDTGTRRMTPSEVYQHRLNSTLMVGKLYRCADKECRRAHANIASGVVIHEDGIVLTNYHVVDSDKPRLLGMGVMTHDGKAFLVEEVLAADQKSDIAILKLANASGLTAAPVFRDEPVGNTATIISNPNGRFFVLTQGLVSRYHVGEKGVPMMNVTADYAKGSSGGPIFNDRGDVIGLVANTYSIPYRHVPLHVDEESGALEIAGRGKKTHTVAGKPLTIGTNHQMTIKNTVPSRAILDLIENRCPSNESAAGGRPMTPRTGQANGNRHRSVPPFGSSMSPGESGPRE